MKNKVEFDLWLIHFKYLRKNNIVNVLKVFFYNYVRTFVEKNSQNTWFDLFFYLLKVDSVVCFN